MSVQVGAHPHNAEVDRLTRMICSAVEATPGVHALGTMPLLLGRASRIPGAQVARAPGLTMAVGSTRAFVGMALVAEAGTALPNLARTVRERVMTSVGPDLGPHTQIDVDVIDIHTPLDDASTDEDHPTAPGGAAAGTSTRPVTRPV